MTEIAASAGVVDAGVDERQIEGEQVARDARADQDAAEHHAEDDRADRQAFDPAVGLDQLGGRQVLGEDAVLGRRVGRRAEADDRIGGSGLHPNSISRQPTTLMVFDDEHHLALGQSVGEGADEGREHHVEDDEEELQRTASARPASALSISRAMAATSSALSASDEKNCAAMMV